MSSRKLLVIPLLESSVFQTQLHTRLHCKLHGSKEYADSRCPTVYTISYFIYNSMILYVYIYNHIYILHILHTESPMNVLKVLELSLTQGYAAPNWGCRGCGPKCVALECPAQFIHVHSRLYRHGSTTRNGEFVAEKFLLELLDLLLPRFSECQLCVDQGAKFDVTESRRALISLRCSEYLWVCGSRSQLQQEFSKGVLVPGQQSEGALNHAPLCTTWIQAPNKKTSQNIRESQKNNILKSYCFNLQKVQALEWVIPSLPHTGINDFLSFQADNSLLWHVQVSQQRCVWRPEQPNTQQWC